MDEAGRSAARVDRAPLPPELSRLVRSSRRCSAERDALLAVRAYLEDRRLLAFGELADDGGHGGAILPAEAGRP
jgi:hypothetical protein